MKLTSKQEKFAELVASGEGQSEAYRKAYDTQNMNDNVISVEASRLMENPKITLRINELREPVITKTHKALENILAELDELKQAAMAKEQYSTAVNAVMGQAKLLGLDKQVIEGAVTVLTMPMVEKDGKPLIYNIGKDIK